MDRKYKHYRKMQMENEIIPPHLLLEIGKNT